MGSLLEGFVFEEGVCVFKCHYKNNKISVFFKKENEKIFS